MINNNLLRRGISIALIALSTGVLLEIMVEKLPPVPPVIMALFTFTVVLIMCLVSLVIE